MGVQSLWQILGPVKKEESIDDLGGRRIAVDLAIWLVESQVTGMKMMQGKVVKPHLRNLFFRVSNLLKLNISLVFVIDGKPPELKWEEMARRNELRMGGRGRGARGGRGGKGADRKKGGGGRSHFTAWLKESQELLELMGVPCVQSRGEAEGMCALLNSQGVVDACMTEDGDAFLCGARKIYRNLNMATGKVDSYCMDDIETTLCLDQKRLVALSLLLGCDYLPKGVPGVGKEGAMRFMKSLPSSIDPLELFQSWHERAGHVPSDVDVGHEVRRKAMKVAGFPNQDVIDEFLAKKEKVPSHQLEWRRPLLAHLQHFNLVKMEWPAEYTQEKVVPLMTLYDLTHTTLDPSCATFDPGERLQPACVVKLRVRQGVQCVEIRWHKPDGDKENDGGEEPYYSTVEDRELFSRVYPDMIPDFLAEKDAKKKKGPAQKKKETASTGQEVAQGNKVVEGGDSKQAANPQEDAVLNKLMHLSLHDYATIPRNTGGKGTQLRGGHLIGAQKNETSDSRTRVIPSAREQENTGWKEMQGRNLIGTKKKETTENSDKVVASLQKKFNVDTSCYDSTVGAESSTSTGNDWQNLHREGGMVCVDDDKVGILPEDRTNNQLPQGSNDDEKSATSTTSRVEDVDDDDVVVLSSFLPKSRTNQFCGSDDDGNSAVSTRSGKESRQEDSDESVSDQGDDVAEVLPLSQRLGIYSLRGALPSTGLTRKTCKDSIIARKSAHSGPIHSLQKDQTDEGLYHLKGQKQQGMEVNKDSTEKTPRSISSGAENASRNSTASGNGAYHKNVKGKRPSATQSPGKSDGVDIRMDWNLQGGEAEEDEIENPFCQNTLVLRNNDYHKFKEKEPSLCQVQSQEDQISGSCRRNCTTCQEESLPGRPCRCTVNEEALSNPSFISCVKLDKGLAKFIEDLSAMSSGLSEVSSIGDLTDDSVFIVDDDEEEYDANEPGTSLKHRSGTSSGVEKGGPSTTPTEETPSKRLSVDQGSKKTGGFSHDNFETCEVDDSHGIKHMEFTAKLQEVITSNKVGGCVDLSHTNMEDELAMSMGNMSLMQGPVPDMQRQAMSNGVDIGANWKLQGGGGEKEDEIEHPPTTNSLVSSKDEFHKNFEEERCQCTVNEETQSNPSFISCVKLDEGLAKFMDDLSIMSSVLSEASSIGDGTDDSVFIVEDDNVSVSERQSLALSDGVDIAKDWELRDGEAEKEDEGEEDVCGSVQKAAVSSQATCPGGRVHTEQKPTAIDMDRVEKQPVERNDDTHRHVLNSLSPDSSAEVTLDPAKVQTIPGIADVALNENTKPGVLSRTKKKFVSSKQRPIRMKGKKKKCVSNKFSLHDTVLMENSLMKLLAAMSPSGSQSPTLQLDRPLTPCRTSACDVNDTSPSHASSAAITLDNTVAPCRTSACDVNDTSPSHASSAVITLDNTVAPFRTFAIGVNNSAPSTSSTQANVTSGTSASDVNDVVHASSTAENVTSISPALDSFLHLEDHRTDSTIQNLPSSPTFRGDPLLMSERTAQLDKTVTTCRTLTSGVNNTSPSHVSLSHASVTTISPTLESVPCLEDNRSDSNKQNLPLSPIVPPNPLLSQQIMSLINTISPAAVKDFQRLALTNAHRNSPVRTRSRHKRRVCSLASQKARSGYCSTRSNSTAVSSSERTSSDQADPRTPGDGGSSQAFTEQRTTSTSPITQGKAVHASTTPGTNTDSGQPGNGSSSPAVTEQPQIDGITTITCPITRRTSDNASSCDNVKSDQSEERTTEDGSISQDFSEQKVICSSGSREKLEILSQPPRTNNPASGVQTRSKSISVVRSQGDSASLVSKKRQPSIQKRKVRALSQPARASPGPRIRTRTRTRLRSEGCSSQKLSSQPKPKLSGRVVQRRQSILKMEMSLAKILENMSPG